MATLAKALERQRVPQMHRFKSQGILLLSLLSFLTFSKTLSLDISSVAMVGGGHYGLTGRKFVTHMTGRVPDSRSSDRPRRPEFGKDDQL